MIGLGYTEALNSSLVSNKIQYELTNRSNSEVIQVVESKSLEHTILRDAIMPGLLENLSKNVHEQYPQKFFEIKSILQSSLKIGFNIECETKTSSHPIFSEGRMANILVNNKIVGVLGEIDSKVIDNFKIRVPVTAFEIQLSGLIFD